MRRLLTLSVVAAMLTASCSSPEAETTSGAAETSPLATATTSPLVSSSPALATSTTQPPREPARTVFTPMDTAMSDRGVQTRIERISVGDGATTVLVGMTNGWDHTVSPLLAARPALELNDGTRVVAEESGYDEKLKVPSGADAAFELTFPVSVAAGDSFNVLVNELDGIVVEVGPLDENLPPLAEQVQMRQTLVSNEGVEVTIAGIAFSEKRIAVGFRGSNGRDFPADLNLGGESYVEDDLGNRYRLIVPDTDPTRRLSIEAGEAIEGVLVFAGRLDPRASTVQVVINDNVVVDRTFRFSVVALGEEPTSSGLPDPSQIDGELVNERGVSIKLADIEFSDESMTVGFSAINGWDYRVDLNLGSESYVEDDLGNRYFLVPPANNERLGVAPGEGIEGALTFAGHIAGDATSIRVVIDESAVRTGFSFGPVTLQRGSSSGDGLAPLAFGDVSDVHGVEIDEGTVEEVKLVLQEFNGVLIPEGILLTLPEDVLFDFDQSVLRPDAHVAIEKIAKVLGYYEGDPVLVLGHTDSIGTDEYNLNLSQERADSVVAGLVELLTIEAGRLTAEGRGEAEPVAPNTNDDGSDNPEGRQLNRRVEVIIQTDEGLPPED